MSLMGLNIGTQDSLSTKTRRYADYYRQLVNRTIKDVYDDEVVTLYNCFYGTNVERVTLPKCTYLANVSTVGSFLSCKKLSYLDLPELQRIGTNAFQNTVLLTSVFFPKVTEAGVSAFANSNIETVNLPMCTRVRTNCFNPCAKLKEIKIPICREIQTGAFYSCTALEKIFLDGVTAMPTLGTNALTGTPDTLKIIVPDTLVDAFKADSNWSAYADQIIGVTEYESTLT